ncbi:MAG: bifunctional diaminohydroxyphosphoribosylaminopyrimidine deaminase/5-amino-6-(5-phosphoribosylamino)uracil reductase RibD [Pirellulaceae bacterium]
MSEPGYTDFDRFLMRRAIELAKRGEGLVEPNPMVGCVITADQSILGEGWHPQFGGPHAEVVALQQAGSRAAGSTAYVSLEPCSHHGKTPPCADALIRAGVRRVVVGVQDPFPEVSGQGIQRLQTAGIHVDVGLLEEDAKELIAPFCMRILQKRPWVLAKWAMTLDGKIATRTGHSQWISNPDSRTIVHAIRARMDAIVVGYNTARHDDPLLTARPAGPRTACRIVLDSQARLPLHSQLVQTASQEQPVVIVTSQSAPAERCAALEACGCQIHQLDQNLLNVERIKAFLEYLATQQMTNVLLEGGGSTFGSFLDAGCIDEAHVFISPRLAGGDQAIGAVGGQGVEIMPDCTALKHPTFERIGSDLYVRGRTH